MKKAITFLLTLLLGTMTSNSQNYQWAKSMGGNSSDIGNSIAVDSSGNVYTTGHFEGIVDFDPGAASSNLTSAGSSDIFISKLNAAGNFLWAKSMGGISTDNCFSIALDGSGNIYTTGSFAGTADFDPGAGTSNVTSVGGDDIFISKLDAAGNFLWVKSVGGIAADIAISIAVDGSGNVYTTGYFQGTADFDPGAGTSNLTSVGNGDIFISKLDAAGNFLWAKSMGGITWDYGNSIDVDAFGNVYTTGHFEGTADLNPGAATNNVTSAGGSDIFISKLDATGNFLWAKSLGGTAGDFGKSIVVDGLGSVYTTGNFEGIVDFDPGATTSNVTSAGSDDIFILKLSTSGNFVWAKNMGGITDDFANSIAVDGNGNVYTTGNFGATADFDPGAGTSNLTSVGNGDIFISKLDAAGNFLWAKGMGGISWDYGKSIDVDAFGNVYTTGNFFGTVDFDPGAGTSNLVSMGMHDIFISKLGSATIGILENSFNNTLQVYPNPTKGDLSIVLGTSYDDITVIIRNILGQDVLNKSYRESNVLQFSLPEEAGMYFIQLSAGDKKAKVKVVKE